jgi:hypothetical protein
MPTSGTAARQDLLSRLLDKDACRKASPTRRQQTGVTVASRPEVS